MVAPAFAGLSHLAVLEGGADQRRDGRWSYLTADPADVIVWDPTGVHTRTGVVAGDDGFEALAALPRRVDEPAVGGPPFRGGAIGYLAYDVAYYLERLPNRCPGAPPAGYLWAGVYDWVLARDGLTGAAWLVASDLGGRDPEALIANARARLQASKPPSAVPGLGSPHSNADRCTFGTWVRQIKAYIAAGDCYQVNVARQIEFDCNASGLDVFRRLAAAHPAAFGAYLETGRLEVVSASPELFVRVAGSRASTRPIKGTRPRGRNPAADVALREELRVSPKDRAENVMIVDVLRNDFGRVCTPGSIGVPELFGTEGHPSVWQLVSEVRGELPVDVGAVDLMRACSPGGSVTGAPKIRATEIIDELEPTRRGVYCGSLFALGFDGSLISSVAIRTLQIADRVAHLHVGAGIVADSECDLEYDETRHKAAGILAALGLEE